MQAVHLNQEGQHRRIPTAEPSTFICYEHVMLYYVMLCYMLINRG